MFPPRLRDDSLVLGEVSKISHNYVTTTRSPHAVTSVLSECLPRPLDGLQRTPHPGVAPHGLLRISAARSRRKSSRASSPAPGKGVDTRTRSETGEPIHSSRRVESRRRKRYRLGRVVQTCEEEKKRKTVVVTKFIALASL